MKNIEKTHENINFEIIININKETSKNIGNNQKKALKVPKNWNLSIK